MNILIALLILFPSYSAASDRPPQSRWSKLCAHFLSFANSKPERPVEDITLLGKASWRRHAQLDPSKKERAFLSDPDVQFIISKSKNVSVENIFKNLEPDKIPPHIRFIYSVMNDPHLMFKRMTELEFEIQNFVANNPGQT